MSKRNRKLSVCARCKTFKHLTKHHVLPLRWFQGEGPIMVLCRTCHDEIEKIIPFRRMPYIFYWRVAIYFVKEYRP